MSDRDLAVELAYQVLGLAPGASETDLRAARLKLVRSFHPDRFTGDRAAADRKLAKINAAFDDVMTDLRKRGLQMTVEERLRAKAARQASPPRASCAAAGPIRKASTGKEEAPRVARAMVRQAADLSNMSVQDRMAHRAAEAAFAATRDMMRVS